MNIGKLISKVLRNSETISHKEALAPPKTRSERDMYFTDNFHAKAAEWGLTEAHARHVFYEGDTVKQDGKPTNMKTATLKGEEIGIYIFRDRDTNQPVITSIWKRQLRSQDAKKSGRSR